MKNLVLNIFADALLAYEEPEARRREAIRNGRLCYADGVGYEDDFFFAGVYKSRALTHNKQWLSRTTMRDCVVFCILHLYPTRPPPSDKAGRAVPPFKCGCEPHALPIYLLNCS